jgi:Homeodomain-like domain
MRDDKNKVLLLRKQGLSYRQIQERLHIPKSTLSVWLSPHKWSKNIKDTLLKVNTIQSKIHIEKLNKVRSKALKEIYKQSELEAVSEYRTLKYHPLFIAGLMLYWGEGDKSTSSTSQIRLGNVDPNLLRVYLTFLLEICGVQKEKIWASVHIYEDLNEGKCIQYWSKILNVSKKQFHKSPVLVGKHKTKRLPYGTCTVGTSSAYLKKKMLYWIEALSKDLLCDTYYLYDIK